jgi:hypothetical protein
MCQLLVASSYSLIYHDNAAHSFNQGGKVVGGSGKQQLSN